MEKEKDERIESLNTTLRKVTKEVEGIHSLLEDFPSYNGVMNRENRRKAERQGVKVQRLNVRLEKLTMEGELIIKKLKDLGAI